jgi:Winged helix-turn helix
MAWCRIQLTADERRIVNEERVSHPSLLVRNKMLTIWLLHCGVTRQKAADIVGVSRATVQRYVEAYCKGGLAGLRHSSVQQAVSELAAFRSTNVHNLRSLRVFWNPFSHAALSSCSVSACRAASNAVTLLRPTAVTW